MPITKIKLGGKEFEVDQEIVDHLKGAGRAEQRDQHKADLKSSLQELGIEKPTGGFKELTSQLVSVSNDLKKQISDMQEKFKDNGNNGENGFDDKLAAALAAEKKKYEKEFAEKKEELTKNAAFDKVLAESVKLGLQENYEPMLRGALQTGFRLETHDGKQVYVTGDGAKTNVFESARDAAESLNKLYPGMYEQPKNGFNNAENNGNEPVDNKASSDDLIEQAASGLIKAAMGE